MPLSHWICDGCGKGNRPVDDVCRWCRTRAPAPSRTLPEAPLIFCAKAGCGCHYLGSCPVHGRPTEPAPA